MADVKYSSFVVVFASLYRIAKKRDVILFSFSFFRKIK